MSLYKDASLVMIPSAYKDGKLYSIRPTDGSGDFTFSRGSNLAATRVDVNGLIEKGRENQILHSNAITTSPWGGPRIFSETQGHTGYDGSNNAWLIIPNTDNGTHYKVQSVSTTSGVNTISVYAKAGGYNYMTIRDDSSGSSYAKFDLANGLTESSGSNDITSKIESVGNGWYRCSLTYLDTGTGNVLFYINETYILSAAYTGDEVSGVYFQDFQLEQGLVATDYIETGASTAQAGILEDMPRLDYSGSCPSLLLEPQRSNILAYSEGMFDSSNFNQINGIAVTGQQTDLNGTNTAVKLSNFVQSSARLDYNTAVAAVDGKTYTYSAYYKGSGDIRINVSTSTGVGGAGEKTITLTDEWVRHSITTTFSSPTGNVKSHLAITRTANNDAEVYMCFAQIEEGSYPTSYIPTYGTSQTRSVDDMNEQLSGLTSLEQGTFCIDFDRGLTTATTRDGSSDGFFYRATSSFPSANAIEIASEPNGNVRLAIRTPVVFLGSVYQNNTLSRYKMLVKWNGSEVKAFVNGSQTYSSATKWGEMTSPLEYIGYNADFRKSVNQLLTFPTALTDSECIALTTL